MPTVFASRYRLARLTAALVLGSLVAASPARADVPGMMTLMSTYDLITLDDLSTSSDVEGRTFVGDSIISSSSANFAIHLSTPASESTLVVVKNIVSGNPLALNAGSLRIGGTTNGRIINYNGGGALIPDPSLSVEPNATILKEASTTIAGYAANNSPTIPSSQPGPLKFTVTQTDACGVAVFSIPGSLLSNGNVQQIELDPGSAQTIVINVSGTSINWSSGNMVSQFTDTFWRARVLWNFYEATSIEFNSRNMMGAVLAPLADITTTANIDGSVVANSLTTSSEVHLPTFVGSPQCVAPTPTPTATPTPTPTPTPVATATPTPIVTATPTPVPTPTPTPVVTATPTPTATATPTPTPVVTVTPTPTPVVTPTPTPVPTPTATPVHTPTPTPDPTATPTPLPTATPLVPPTPTPAPTGTPLDPASVCNHSCPDTIKFARGTRPGNLVVRSAFPFGVVLDPAHETFQIVVRNADGIVYQGTLLPGDLKPRGKNFMFLDRTARKGPGTRDGLFRVEISSVQRNRGTRVTVNAYGDMSAATLAEMAVEITLGSDVIESTATWQPKRGGWANPHF